jgi:acyl-CoA synthetase (AMP-forming)/AMP-acid ligase II
MTSLIDLLRARAAESPDRLAFAFLADGIAPSATLTFAQLDHRARATAAWLQPRFPAGSRVLLLHPPGMEFLVAFLGCVYAGLVAIPAYPPRGKTIDARIRAIGGDAQASLALTTAEQLPKLTTMAQGDADFAGVDWQASDPIADGPVEGWRDPQVSGDTVAHLQYTSGSTATPRGVMVTHRNLLNNLLDMHLGWAHDADSVIVSWLPHFHDMGLVYGLLEPIYAGVPCYFMPPVAFIQKPVRWLQAVSTFKATHSAAPNFAYDLCVRKIKPDDRRALDLSRWAVAVNGAEAVRAQTLARFVEAFGPAGFREDTFCPGYGLAEATLKVTASPRGQHPLRLTVDGGALDRHLVATVAPTGAGARTLVGCGVTATDTDVAIVDPDTGHRRGADEVGEIWVAGTNVAAGYWNRPADTAETFQAGLDGGDARRFLRTGDLGFLREGQLFIVGRRKDLIIIRGQNYYPQDIEQTVEAIGPEFRSHGCAAFSVDLDGEERLIVAQEIERVARDADVADLVGRVKQTVAEAFEVSVYDVVILREGALPRTTSGKIQHQACRHAYTTGTVEGRVT